MSTMTTKTKIMDDDITDLTDLGARCEWHSNESTCPEDLQDISVASSNSLSTPPPALTQSRGESLRSPCCGQAL
ncbi:hypothetical protein PoB_002226600 [Plakobranchus ocellatus]|uniref:Uncharacterized protein n=1 Tax=Plakobranchus ocellatus TaxID=259542 RepID=A0AAV3ZIM2_9GAST|nr:hypothetical protein PoB_002226600 [Plakobranchus ocellatus]